MAAGRGYDYVIVGAGSAGCALASRLTEDDGARVLVLEAGPWDRDPWIGIPLAWGRNVLRRRHDWMYSSEPIANLGGRRLAVYRGKVIGGSSAINAMAYVRGHRGDYQRWAESGLPGWSYADVLPYFKRQESWEDGGDAYRGGDGPLTTCRPAYPDPLSEAFLAAGAEGGFPYTPDYNGARQEGFSPGQSTLRNGRRCSAAVAYLHPARARASLTVATGVLVTRVVIENGRAVGVEYVKDGAKSVARAEREVILSGGSINSPQILMLSGIGDPAELARFGIAVTAAVPGVGKNLQEHLQTTLNFSRREPGPLHHKLRADRIVVELAKAHFLGTGMAATLPNNVKAFLKTSPEEKIPDLQLLFRATATGAGPYFPPFKKAFADGFGVGVVPVRPESRGSLALASADPRDQPLIRMNFLATDKDLRTMRAGIRIAREVFAQKALKPFLGAELTPGPDKMSDAELDAFARETGDTVYHPLGTCRMGPDSDPLAVVDPELRVRGVERLRVVDAAVMPDLTGGNINAPVIMIAEKAADLIRGRPPLAPHNV